MNDQVNEQLTQQLLEQLRDVQLPEPVSWWPPAPIWWFFALCAIALVIIGLLQLIRHRRRNTYRRAAIAALKAAQKTWQQDGETRAYLDEASRTLRRVAIHLLGRDRVARLTEKAWLDTLDSMAQAKLSPGSRDGLTVQLYRPQPKVDVAAMHSELLNWLRSHSRNPKAS